MIAGQVSARDRKIPRVTTAKASVEDMVSKVTANGKIQAEKKVELSALVMGQIVNLAVRDGDSVKKGDFLLQIDRNRAVAEEAGSAAALAGSLAALDSAQATLDAGAPRLGAREEELRREDPPRGGPAAGEGGARDGAGRLTRSRSGASSRTAPT